MAWADFDIAVPLFEKDLAFALLRINLMGLHILQLNVNHIQCVCCNADEVLRCHSDLSALNTETKLNNCNGTHSHKNQRFDYIPPYLMVES